MSSPRRLSDPGTRANPITTVHVWRTPATSQADVIVVSHLSVYAQMRAHAIDALPSETGGFLLGSVGHDPGAGTWLVTIDEAVRVTPVTQDPVRFTLGWQDVDRVRRQRDETGKALVGWFHSHPDLGIFLSDTDLDRMHRLLFSEPFQLALVYDPVRGKAGYFFWEQHQQIDPSQAEWREFDVGPADG